MLARITIAFVTVATVVSGQCSTPSYGSCGSDAAGVSCCPSSQYCQPWDSNYYQCLDFPAQCNQQFTNVDFNGDDLQTIYGIQPGELTPTPTPTATSAPSPTPTSSTCSTAPYGSCGSNTGTTCCPSGYYCQPWSDNFYQCIQPPSQCSSQRTDVEYSGNDLQTVYVSLPSLCCDACSSTTGCKAYTYINNNPGQPVCYLKSAAGTASTKIGAVSGILN
ncbi:A cellulose-binding elicitor and lectin-like protein [Phytophthora megakarya]|uniref:A cellulose-binding elicitor and lectin-like protein n=1 Tax=Phytophthora megakarya TaxID=4795 RepID=A0A225V861_9STRA|nr:A cellulose-binding elicitor and lectin-like protein [Phytophthora megakarya]